jgi:cytochrome d ubiquinol oxidase subunit I
MSAFWILSLNSWMQTPAGYEVVLGKFYAKDWWSVVFNPSFPYRLAHVLVASTLTASFLIAGMSAWQLLRNSATAGTHKAMRTAIAAAAIAIPLQFLIGDAHGLNTLHHQPAKIAAIEGIWHTERGAPLTLFGWPDEKQGRTLYALQVPKLASLILAHDMNAELKGLNEFQGAHPPVAPVFWAFRVMVGVGSLMLVVAWCTAWQLWRSRGGSNSGPSLVRLPRPLLYVLAAMSFSGWIATLAGWYVTEIGRQPFIVYDLVRTSEVVAQHAPSLVSLTLAAYVLVYGLLLVTYAGVLKYMAEHPTHHAALAGDAPTSAAAHT